MANRPRSFPYFKRLSQGRSSKRPRSHTKITKLKSLRAFPATFIAILLLLSLTTRGGGVVTNATEANLLAAIAGGGTGTFACDATMTLTSTITNALTRCLTFFGLE